MSALSDSPNHFLACLSLQDSELLQSHLKPMELGLGAIFYRAQDTIDRVYFPHTGVVSLVVGLASGQFVEAGRKADPLSSLRRVGCRAASSRVRLILLAVKLLDGFRPLAELGGELRKRYLDVCVTGFVCEL